MGVTFSSPELAGAQSSTPDVPYSFSTSYAFAGSDVNDFGFTASITANEPSPAGGSLSAFLTVPPYQTAGASSTYLCTTFPVTNGPGTTATASLSIDCPGVANTAFGAGTAMLLFTQTATYSSGLFFDAFSGTYGFSVTTLSTTVTTTTTHQTVTQGLIPVITTTTLSACPSKPASITTAKATIAASKPATTILSTSTKKKDSWWKKRDVGFSPPDYTLSNGQTPPPVTSTVTVTGKPTTVRPTITITLPDLNVFDYKTCAWWPN